MNIQQVLSYGNISFFNPIPTYFKQLKKDTDVSSFSYLQESKAREHISELMSALETLCNEPELKIKQIIILCSDILQMLKTVPSVSEKNKFVDMRLEICPSIVRMAAMIENYYDDPSSITQEDIQGDCIRVADHV